MLQRDGHPTALGEAIAVYGRIPKTLHICAMAAEEAYRRDIKGMRNLQEGRHALAGKTFHGKKGKLYQRYHEGMEDQLRAQGYLVLGEDVAQTMTTAEGRKCISMRLSSAKNLIAAVDAAALGGLLQVESVGENRRHATTGDCRWNRLRSFWRSASSSLRATW